MKYQISTILLIDKMIELGSRLKWLSLFYLIIYLTNVFDIEEIHFSFLLGRAIKILIIIFLATSKK